MAHPNSQAAGRRNNRKATRAARSRGGGASDTSLKHLAKRINDAHAGVVRTFRTSTEHAIRCGELLLEAKGRLRHGEWETWLSRNTKMSDRTARDYMLLAKLPAAKRRRVADLGLGIRAALEHLAAEKTPALNRALTENTPALRAIFYRRSEDNAGAGCATATSPTRAIESIPLEHAPALKAVNLASSLNVGADALATERALDALRQEKPFRAKQKKIDDLTAEVEQLEKRANEGRRQLRELQIQLQHDLRKELEWRRSQPGADPEPMVNGGPPN